MIPTERNDVRRKKKEKYSRDKRKHIEAATTHSYVPKNESYNRKVWIATSIIMILRSDRLTIW